MKYITSKVHEASTQTIDSIEFNAFSTNSVFSYQLEKIC